MDTVQLISQLVTSIGFPAVMCILMYKLIDKMIAQMQESHEQTWAEIVKVVEGLTVIMQGIKEDLDLDAKRD